MSILHVALSAAPCPAIALDRQSRITFANAATAAINGCEPEALVGRVADAVWPDTADMRAPLVWAAWRGEPIAPALGYWQGVWLELTASRAGRRVVVYAVDRSAEVELAAGAVLRDFRPKSRALEATALALLSGKTPTPRMTALATALTLPGELRRAFRRRPVPL